MPDIILLASGWSLFAFIYFIVGQIILYKRKLHQVMFNPFIIICLILIGYSLYNLWNFTDEFTSILIMNALNSFLAIMFTRDNLDSFCKQHKYLWDAEKRDFVLNK